MVSIATMVMVTAVSVVCVHVALVDENLPMVENVQVMVDALVIGVIHLSPSLALDPVKGEVQERFSWYIEILHIASCQIFIFISTTSFEFRIFETP